MKFAEHIVDLVGDTPLVKLASVTEGIEATVLAKIEYLNPGGSVKDRIALKMVEAAEASGELQPGGVIVEPTSGNTGVGPGARRPAPGLLVHLRVPRQGLRGQAQRAQGLRRRGRRLPDRRARRTTPTPTTPTSDRLVRETPGAWKPDQYSNPNGPLSHYETTGPEIWRDTDGRVTHFVTGAGTGGTISGAGRYLREVSADREGGRVRVVAADPEGSVYSGGTRPPLPRRGRRRGLLALGLRPRPGRRGRRRSPTPSPSR